MILIGDPLSSINGTDPVHQIVSHDEDNRHGYSYPNNQQRILLMLRNAGSDVNALNQDGQTPLHVAMDNGRADLCKVLLQAGALTNIQDKDGRSPFNTWQTERDSLDTEVGEVFDTFMPGLWKAVHDDDLMCVRKLVNLWCRVDITSDGKTLLQLSLEKGTEDIIRLIKEIAPSMKLVHSVLTLDLDAVTQICENNKTLNLEFRNLGDNGATPLYYAVQANHLPIVHLLMEKGAKVTTTLSMPDTDVDVPLYFTALHSEVSCEVIKRITPRLDQCLNVDQLRFQGSHVLFYCIDNDAPPEAVKYILQQSLGFIVALRNHDNLTPRQYAENMTKHDYVSMIDQAVSMWMSDATETDRQCNLSLLGYDLFPRNELQIQVEAFSEAIQNDDLDSVVKLVYYTTDDQHPICLVDSRTRGDSQPALHMAVLVANDDIVMALVEVWVGQEKKKLDDIRDERYRTALHYARGMGSEGSSVASILLDHGASDFALDMENHSPLLFRETCDHPLMKELIDKHLWKDYTRDEPNPWRDPNTRKIRVICNHHKQELINRERTEETNPNAGFTCTLL